MSIKGRLEVILDNKVVLSQSCLSGLPENFGKVILDFFNGEVVNFSSWNGEAFPWAQPFDYEHFAQKLRLVKQVDYQDGIWEGRSIERERRYDLGPTVIAFVYHFPEDIPIYLVAEEPGPVEWNYQINLDTRQLLIRFWEWGTDVTNLRIIALYELDNLPLFFSEEFGS